LAGFSNICLKVRETPHLLKFLIKAIMKILIQTYEISNLKKSEKLSFILLKRDGSTVIEFKI